MEPNLRDILEDLKKLQAVPWYRFRRRNALTGLILLKLFDELRHLPSQIPTQGKHEIDRFKATRIGD